MFWFILEITLTGSKAESFDFLICGNHNDCFYGTNFDGLDENVHYLCNSGVEIAGMKFYDVPMFMGDCITDRQSYNIAKNFENINTLITHSPPHGILDFDNNIHYGSEEFLIMK